MVNQNEHVELSTNAFAPQTGTRQAAAIGDQATRGRLRRWLEERDVAQVLAVNCNQSLVSGLFRFACADQLAARIPAGAWRDLSAGPGAKGERCYAWARVAIRPLREPGRGHWLLVRRSLADGELAH